MECVSVAVSGLGLEKEKFLGDKAIADGKGVSVGAAVKEVLDEWGIKPWNEREAELEAEKEAEEGMEGEGQPENGGEKKKPVLGVLSYDTTAVNTSRDIGTTNNEMVIPQL